MTGPVVVLNPRAGGGRAARQWQTIASALAQRTGSFAAILSGTTDQVTALIGEWAGRGATRFLAAGGDGTVNLLVTTLAKLGPRFGLETFRVGAVGLGSSNDFHKPIREESRIDGVPCRVDFSSATPHDVCVLDYRDPYDGEHRRFWIINASIGTTAEANWFFNRPNAALRWLKAALPGIAKAYAALHALFRFRGLSCTLVSDGASPTQVRIRNLGVVKNPHFSGWLHFDSPYEPASGRFWIHLLKPVAPPRLLVTLVRLVRGRFQGQRATRSWPASRLAIQSEVPFAIEADGEVVLARSAVFSVFPRKLGVCP